LEKKKRPGSKTVWQGLEVPPTIRKHVLHEKNTAREQRKENQKKIEVASKANGVRNTPEGKSSVKHPLRGEKGGRGRL